MHEVRDGGQGESDTASSDHKDGARVTVHHSVSNTSVRSLNPHRCLRGTPTIARVDSIVLHSHVIQPVAPISPLLHHEREAVATSTSDGEGVNLGPAKNTTTGRKDAKAGVLAWTPACVEVRDLDPSHPQLRDWAEGCDANSGLEHSNEVVKSVYTRRGNHPWDGRGHVQGDPNWNEDNPKDMGEEESVVKPCAPKADGEQEKDVHGDQPDKTESNVVSQEFFRDDSLQGPFVD